MNFQIQFSRGVCLRALLRALFYGDSFYARAFGNPDAPSANENPYQNVGVLGCGWTFLCVYNMGMHAVLELPQRVRMAGDSVIKNVKFRNTPGM